MRPDFDHSAYQRPNAARDFVWMANVVDYDIHLQKQRREDAIKQAKERGLDAEEERQKKRKSQAVFRARSNRRRDPVTHARILLRETQLPFKEISSITGMDVYDVVGLKLKMRQAS